MGKIFIYSLLLTSLLTPFISFSQEQDDPDVPSRTTGIDKEQYLIERQNYFLMRHGDPSRFSINPKMLAIEHLLQMEKARKENHEAKLLSPGWVQLGPAPIPNGQTTTVANPVSGRITSVAVHPTNENIVYIGCANGGVYRSMNGGTSWTQIFTGAQSFAVGALALAPSNPTILYVGTGEPQASADSYAGVGLYRIDNADASPSLVGPINPVRSYLDASSNPQNVAVFNFRAISKILVHPTNPAIIFVSTASAIQSNPSTAAGGGTIPPLGIRGIYRSTNATAAAGTVSFTKLTIEQLSCFDNPCTGNATISDMIMEPGNPDNILVWVNTTMNASAALGGGIYRTTNSLAATPTFTKTYFPTSSSVRGEFAIASISGTVTVYAGTGEAASGRLLKSTNGGTSWSTTAGTYGFCTSQCFYDIALAVDPTNANNVYIGGSAGTNLFRRSTNGLSTIPGTTNSVGLHADVHSIVVAPSNPSIVYMGNDGGIFKSVDGAQTWTSMNTAGLHATQFQSLALHPTDPNFMIGGTQDNGTILMTAPGVFLHADNGDGGYALIDQNATDAVNVVMYHTYFNTTTAQAFTRADLTADANHGATGWPFFYGCGFGGATANGISCTGISACLFYAPMALGPGNPNTVYFASDRLYRSVNKGVAMTVVSQAPIASGSAISTISIATGTGANADDNYRIVGLTNGKVFGTITGSTTLVDISPSTITFPVGRVFISPLNKNVAYVCYTGYFSSGASHIYKTSNLNNLGGSGVTWTAIGSGLPNVPVNAFAMSHSNPNIIFAGTDIGVFASTDAGNSWSDYNGGILPNVPVFDMAVHKTSNVLRIATHGTGFWETSVIVPVTFTEFRATVRNKTRVLLEWFTATETNNKGFEIERSLVSGSASNKWEKIGFVNGRGTTTDPGRYEFEDVPVGGKKFIYRLRQVDFDNNFKYTDQRQVTLNDFDFALFPVFPNPVRQSATIKFQVPEDGPVTLAIFDANGALVKYLVNEKKESGIFEITLNTNGLAQGTYYLQLKNGTYKDTKPFVVQH